MRTGIRKYGKQIIYHVLREDLVPVRCLPEGGRGDLVQPPGLSYRLVLLTLCDSLSSVYSRLASASPLPAYTVEAALKVDKALKVKQRMFTQHGAHPCQKLFFGWVCKLTDTVVVNFTVAGMQSPEGVLQAWEQSRE